MTDGLDQFEEEIGGVKLPVLERIVYDLITECRKSLGAGQALNFCNAVEFFALSFPYTDKETTKKLHNLNIWLQNQMTMYNKTQGKKPNIDSIYMNYAMRKYGIITELLKKKNLFPKPAEHEVYE